MRDLGVPEVYIDASRVERCLHSDDFEVWQENWESLSWFLKMSRRWIFNPMDGRRIRLDDGAVMVQLKLHVAKKSERKIIMEDLLEMEAAALEILNRE